MSMLPASFLNFVPESVMSKRILILATVALLWFSWSWPALGAQEPQAQQSLGDLARQVRRNKETNSTRPKTVITDDTLPSKKEMDSSALVSEFDDEEDAKNANAAPEEARKLVLLGNAKYEEHNFQAAIEAYLQAIRIYPNRWKYHYNLGCAYGHLDKMQEAIAAYQRAKALAPKRLEICQNLGHALCKTGQWNEAIAEFEELLKIDPTWNMARPCLYQALLATGRNVEAQKVYEDEQKYKPMGHAESSE
jgi:tetratricopeptide (TPR) repeat protein